MTCFLGYLEFNTQHRLGTGSEGGRGVKSLLPEANWGLCAGNKASNVTYCSKDVGRLEPTVSWPDGWKDAAGQGQRSDLDQACALVKSTGGVKRVAEELPGVFIKFHRGLERLAAVLAPKRSRGCTYTGIWMETPTGYGKSTAVWKYCEEYFPGNYFMWSPKHKTSWFDGYEGEKVIVFDEFTRGDIGIGELLRLINPLPYSAPVHGGVVSIRADTFIFTSNDSIESTFQGVDASSERLAAFTRRVPHQLDDEDRERLGAMPTVEERGTWLFDWLGDVLGRDVAAVQPPRVAAPAVDDQPGEAGGDDADAFVIDM
jgi:hypothetical protein